MHECKKCHVKNILYFYFNYNFFSDLIQFTAVLNSLVHSTVSDSSFARNGL